MRNSLELTTTFHLLWKPGMVGYGWRIVPYRSGVETGIMLHLATTAISLINGKVVVLHASNIKRFHSNGLTTTNMKTPGSTSWAVCQVYDGSLRYAPGLFIRSLPCSIWLRARPLLHRGLLHEGPLLM